VLCVAVLCHDFDMEQRTAIKFCSKLGKSASKTYKKRMQVILCLVQRHFIDLNDFETQQGPHGKIPCENNVHRLLRRSRRDSP
jgi:hypothetical protein